MERNKQGDEKRKLVIKLVNEQELKGCEMQKCKYQLEPHTSSKPKISNKEHEKMSTCQRERERMHELTVESRDRWQARHEKMRPSS